MESEDLYLMIYLQFKITFTFWNLILWSEYQIINILDNDLDAIHSRIKFVQNLEPSSFYGVII